MSATALLADLRSAGVIVRADAGRLKLDAPRGALPESVMSAVRESKVELLKLLEPADVAPTPAAALFSCGPGAGCGVATPTPARAAPVAPEYSTTQEPSKADAEFSRFERVAVRTPSGGLRDPDLCSPELAEQIRVGGLTLKDSTPCPGVPPGWPVNGWRRHLLHMADSCKEQHPEKASEYRRKADSLGAAS